VWEWESEGGVGGGEALGRDGVGHAHHEAADGEKDLGERREGRGGGGSQDVEHGMVEGG